MKNSILVFCLAMLIITTSSCSKQLEKITEKISQPAADTVVVSPTAPAGFVQYTIKQGEQYCDKSTYAAIKCSELAFKVKFDSSAIYQTQSPSNQTDINKLYGFSDNNAAHHDFSARFGWRWSNNALRLFAYTYNNSVVSMKELGTVAIGAEISCSIKVSGEQYIFTLDGVSTSVPRASATVQAEGYQLYPYFGGDEMAPHEVRIWIKQL